MLEVYTINFSLKYGKSTYVSRDKLFSRDLMCQGNVCEILTCVMPALPSIQLVPF